MTTYYVSQSGSNGAATSLATAKTTIAAGCALLGVGDTLLINDGTYTEGLNNAIPSGSTDSARTIIQAIHSRQVIINGVSTHDYVIEIENRNYITLDGLVLDANMGRYACITAGDDAGGLGGAGSTYITIQNCTARNSLAIGLSFHGGAVNHHISVLNNIIHTCGTVNPTYDGNDGHAIYPGFHDGLVAGNTIYNIGNSVDGGASIHQYNSGAGGLHNNVYRNNLLYDSYGSGILVTDCTGCLVYNNVLYNNNLLVEGAGAIQVGAAATGVQIYNNTIVDNNDIGIRINGSSTTTVRNNIAYLNTAGDYSDGGSGTTHNTNLEGTNPPFVDGPAHNFNLASTATGAINVGADLSSIFTTDYDGSIRPPGSWDIGAYEYLAIGPPTGNSRHLIANDPFSGGVLVALGGNWQQLNTVGATLYKTVAGYVGGSPAIAENHGAARWVAASFGSDHYSSLEVRSLTSTVDGSSFIGVCGRASADQNTAHDMYCLLVQVISGVYYTQMFKVVDGVTTTLVSSRTDISWATGDRIEMECQGSTIYALKSGSILFSAPDGDSALAAGAPGILGAGTLDSLGDNWEGGNLNDPGTSEPAHKGRRLVFMKVGG